jgi:soluble lytic murein transglycosylase-like protein
MPPTAQQMAQKLGLPFNPGLLQSNDPAALDYQQRLGQAYLQEGLAKTGNLRDALRYYHGGPNRSQWGPKTNSYADSIMSRLR